jgi:predicted phosphodiesterase
VTFTRIYLLCVQWPRTSIKSSRTPDAVFCLGDLVDFAPWPNQVIETVRQWRIPTIMGNHDERIAFDGGSSHSENTQKRSAQREWTRSNLHAGRSLRRIGNTSQSFPAQCGFAMEPEAGQERFCWFMRARAASTSIYADHPETDLIRMLRSNDGDVIAMGHTHLPYIRPLSGGKFVINTGSVGRSKEDRISGGLPDADHCAVAHST